MSDIGQQRAAVVAEAMAWEGTPRRHMGRVKGAGVDCAQFPYCVYRAEGLVPEIPLSWYPPDWHCHRRNGQMYLEMVLRHLHEVEVPGPGDLVLFLMGDAYAHGALVLDWPRIIHADARAGFVTEADARDDRHGRLCHRFFSPWGAR